MTHENEPLQPVRKELDLSEMIRVNQAGEYGATRIYAGQRAVMGDHVPEARAIAGMATRNWSTRIERWQKAPNRPSAIR